MDCMACWKSDDNSCVTADRGTRVRNHLMYRFAMMNGYVRPSTLNEDVPGGLMEAGMERVRNSRYLVRTWFPPTTLGEYSCSSRAVIDQYQLTKTLIDKCRSDIRDSRSRL